MIMPSFLDQRKVEPDIAEQWLYLDPQDNQHGPFDSKQMQMWFANGYFKSDLRLRPTNSPTFTTLGMFFKGF